MTDFRLQRLNMVESQVRPSDITDQRIIRAMLEVPREAFVPPAFAAMAYIDDPVPAAARPEAGQARYLLPPRTFAKLVQLAGVEPGCSVLDVGCATGYSTAVLAKLAKRVVAVEVDRELARAAARILRELGAGNAVVVEGPLADGARAEAPFDVILLNGAVPAVASSLLVQLADGGRLVAMLNEGPLCRANVWRRGSKSIDRRPAFEGAAAGLAGFEAPAEFVL